MSSYGLEDYAQWERDNAEPPRYNHRPLYSCVECGQDIYEGDICYVFSGHTKLCERCVDYHREVEEE